VHQKNSNLKIIYITSEEFTNEVVEAIRGNDTARMKKRFRNVNLLIIDDVQFFAGKEKVQEELFHTFNALVDKGAQMVLSSDRHPSEIKKLEKRLSSRFSGGLAVDISPPDFELRTAILLIKAKKYGIDLPIDIAKKIAEKAQDARELEGLLLRVITEAKAKKNEITSQLVDMALNSHGEEQKPHRHPDDLIKRVCVFYDIKPIQIKSAKRSASLVKARQICMYLLKNELGLTYVEIGNLLGGRDHTTIMYGVEKIGKTLIDKKNHGEIMGITSFINEQVS
jgi:chromosomal replication initiator protein